MADLRTDSRSCKHTTFTRFFLRGGCLFVLGCLALVLSSGSFLNAQQTAPQPTDLQMPEPDAKAGPTPDESLAAANPEDKVVDVKIQGNKSLPLDKILPHIRTRPGRPFDLEVIEEDVRRLDRTHMFVNVKTYWQKVAGGRIVIFDILERPLLKEVLFVGCDEIHKKTLQKQAELKTGDPVDPYAIEEARRKLEEFYHSRGFNGARIVLLEGDKPEDRRAIFLINEGTKQRVWNINFIGNTIAEDGRLKTQIQSKPPFLYLFKGELDRKQVDEDIDRLTAYYRGLGFFRARIGREISFNEKENWATLTFVVDEGPRYKIRDVSVLGNTKYTSQELMTDLKLNKGDYFNQAKHKADQLSIQDKYGSVGYVFTDVKPELRFLEEPGQLDIVYNLAEGDRYRVGKINVDIRGEYPHTQITTILNRLSLQPGDIIDIREIRASERRIRASGLFESNPASGNAPKIVFNPPDQDGSQVAEKPSAPDRRPGGKFRGQSPDKASQDRDIDITLDCGRYVGPPPTSNDPPGPNSIRGISGVSDGQVRVLPVAASATHDLARSAEEYQQALTLQRKPQSPSRLIPTQQYTRSTTTNTKNGNLKWTNPTGAASASDGSTVSANYMAAPDNGNAGVVQTSGTEAVPAETSPAYGQRYPRASDGFETAGQNLQPGPIFNENSPFNGGPPDGGEPFRSIPLDIKAEETMTGRLMFGVGVNSDSGLVGQVILDEQNFDWTRIPTSWEEIRNGTAFRGAGQRFRIEAVPGTTTQRYMVNFQEPYMFGTQYSLGLSGYYYNRIYDQYTDQRLGGRLAMGKQLTPDLTTTLAYRGAKVNITDPVDPALPDLAEVTGRDLSLHGFQWSLTHDKRDSAFLPTEGHLLEGSFEQVIGSFQYPRVELDARKYFTMYERPDGSGRQVLSVSAHAGYTGDDTPIYDRFYAGGFSTIRGFSYRAASPIEVGPSTGQDIIVGGNFELLASVEYMFPITADDMLRGVIFCDSGTVEPDINDWSNKYRVAPGFGLRIVVPAMGQAPIALDFAFPVSWNHGDEQEVFSFFMGFNR